MEDLELESIRLLDWMYDHGGDGAILSVNGYAALRGLTDQNAWTLGEHLNASGLARVLLGMSMRVDADLTAAGVAFVQQMRTERDDAAKRNSSLRQQMLKWLYAHECRDEKTLDWNGFIEAGYSHLGGRPFQANEVHRQAEYLSKRGFITSSTIDNVMDGCLNPRLKPDGEDCVTDFDGEVTKYMNRGGAGNGGHIGDTYNITDNRGNVITGGSRNTQSVTHGIDTSAVLKFAGTLAQSLPVLGLSEDAQAEVRAQSDELHAEASGDQPNVGRMRSLIDSLMGAVAKASTTAVGAIVTELGNEALKAITGG